MGRAGGLNDPAAADAANAARLRRFATREAPRLSPFYAALAGFAAEAPDALAILRHRLPGQPPANMLLGAVHRLLLDGADHDLRAFYPNLVERPRPLGEAGPALADFCRRFREPLTAIVARRVTCTNEVRRAIMLRLGFGWMAAHGAAEGARPGLVEIGCSAGLNLNWDRFRIDLGRHGRFGPRDAPLTLGCRVDGAGPVAAGGPLPAFARRIGIDVVRSDPADAGDRAWMQALVWPDNPGRRAALDAAIAIAIAHPAEIRIGDAARLVGPVLAGLADDGPVWVFHSVMMYQLPVQRRLAIERALAAASRRRPVWRLAFEGEGARRYVLRVVRYGGGQRRMQVRLAESDGHVTAVRLYRPIMSR
ncbi:MAG: DUF2332 domain-containing protein [Alphaproteobacteria bacterium]